MTRDTWPVARLIPISSATGVEAQERRAASALLAVVSAVPDFAKALFKPLGASAGRFRTFIEVPLKLGDRSFRPDGVVSVTRGNREWRALVEVKTGKAEIEAVQMNAYLDIARDLGFDAVVSISNQFVTSSARYPVAIDKRKLKKLTLKHWSWSAVLTEAVVVREHRGVSDPDQAYILSELIRYLSDPRSGLVAFDGMGSHWTEVRDGTRHQTVRKSDPAVAGIAGRWDDLVQYLSLTLTAKLGRQVKQALPPAQRSAEGRRQALCASLGENGKLTAELQVPDVVGSLVLEADLRARQVTASTRLDAPREGTSRGRVSWLLRQLQDAPESLRLESRAAYSSTPIAATLAAARENPSLLYPEGKRELKQFMLSLNRNMGLKRDIGPRSFAESVLLVAEDFYADVLQNLRAWKASPPKLKKAPAGGGGESRSSEAQAPAQPLGTPLVAAPPPSPQPPTSGPSDSSA